MRDYAQGYRSKVVHHAAVRQYGGRVVAQPLRSVFWKTFGVVVVMAMCAGIMASFWIGHRLQSNLSSIALLQESSRHELDMKKKLVLERDGLVSTPRMLATAAVQTGLYQPTVKQSFGFTE